MKNVRTTYLKKLIKKPNRNRIKTVNKDQDIGHGRNCYLCIPTKNEMQ